MQEIPEYWTAKNQKEDFRFLTSEIYPVLKNEVLLFLLSDNYNSEEKIIGFLKTPDGIKFNEFAAAFQHILISSGYDSKEKITAFLNTFDGNMFYESIRKYSPALICILINSGYYKIQDLNTFFNSSEENFSGKYILGFS